MSSKGSSPTPLGAGASQVTKASAYNRTATKLILQMPRKRVKSGSRAPGQVVNVFYDSTGVYSWVGDLYSTHMVNLLTHFNVDINRIPVEQYKAGQLEAATANFYLGMLFDNPLPKAFTDEAVTTTKPLCWVGYNLWKIAWNSNNSWNTAFNNKFGMMFYYMDSLGYPTVNYKGQNLTKLQFQPQQGRVEITNPLIATRLATSTRPDGLSI